MSTLSKESVYYSNKIKRKSVTFSPKAMTQAKRMKMH